MTENTKPVSGRRRRRTTVIVIVCLFVAIGLPVALLFTSHGVREFGLHDYWLVCTKARDKYTASYAASFSPDNSVLAFLYGQGEVPKDAEPRVRISQAVFLRWCDVSDPSVVNSVQLDSVGLEWYDYSILRLVRYRFSPDSKHIAVIARGKLVCVALASGRHWPLSKESEIVSGFAWRGDHEVGYSAHTNIHGVSGEASDRSFWVQDVHAAVEERTCIDSQSGIESGGTRWDGKYASYCKVLESWSPTGRHVLFRTDDESASVLSIKDSEVADTGTYPIDWNGTVSWKPDGSAVFLGSTRNWQRPPVLAELIDTDSLKTTDLSKEWTKLFPDGADLQPLWTADGRYVIVSGSGQGGILLQPVPWKVIRLGEKCKELFEMDDGSTEFRAPALHRLPVPGWVRADDFAVDYEGRKMVELSGREPVLSRDGKLIADVDEKGNVTIKPTVILSKTDGDAGGQ